MANSRFEYTRDFEQSDHILRNTWIVVRVDGRSFHRFSAARAFRKPNDLRALSLMNKAAECVMRDIGDLVLGYGQSDEFSFVFAPDSMLFERRASKLVTTIVSTLTAYYNLYWPAFFPGSPLFETKLAESDVVEGPSPSGDSNVMDVETASAVTGPIPTFDGRAVAYPTTQNLRDYLSWRQVDCHINNLYNTTFWTLVQRGGMSNTEAELHLKGTLSADKNEMLFSQFAINYNNEPSIFKKGTVVYRDCSEYSGKGLNNAEEKRNGEKPPDLRSKRQQERRRKRRAKAVIRVEHVDLVEDAFWIERPWLLDTNV